MGKEKGDEVKEEEEKEAQDSETKEEEDDDDDADAGANADDTGDVTAPPRTEEKHDKERPLSLCSALYILL